MWRLGYAIFSVVLLGLSAMFVVRMYDNQERALPRVDAPAELTALSCEDGLDRARDLTKKEQLEPARVAYLSVIARCANSPVLPDALLEVGSLSGHLLQRPTEARQAYTDFLRLFPKNPRADDATYHLAKLDLDAGDYASAISHLTLLAQEYPESTHQWSAQFLAAKAAELLAADRHSLQTFLGQLRKLVPNNILSLLALLAAVGPAALQIVGRDHPERATRQRLVPILVLLLTFINYFVNNLESQRQNKRLMSKLDQLVAIKE